MERIKSLPTLGYLWALAIFFSACSPKTTSQRGYEKYAYLLKDRAQQEKQEEYPTYESEQDSPNSWEKVSQVEAWEEKTPHHAPEEPFNPRKSSSIDKVLETADSFVGVPYRYGGMSRKGVDCSGLVCKAYEAAGVRLPRSSRAQAGVGKSISMNRLQPGDLVFFSAKRSSQNITHVGIVSSVAGKEIEFIHASTSKGVRYDRLDEGYWKPLFRKGVSLRKKRADLGL